MILVLGGTTEGKQAIEVLQALRQPFLYSTKTKVSVPEGVQARVGALNVTALQGLIQSQGIRLIVHAAHPFATELHQTLHTAARATQVPVLRLERQYPARTHHPLVHYVADYPTALQALSEKPHRRLLALSGVQSIPKLKAYWQHTPTYFRILDRDESKAIARENGFPAEQLILGLSDGTLAHEVETLREKRIDIVLTKESGETGGLSTKISAALACKVPILILEKPSLPDTFQSVHSPDELHAAIQTYLSTPKPLAP